MKVVALLSGGKDSCFTLFKARQHGHDVVALAHVKPPIEEADSFMYQSIGSNVINYIADALQLPLFTITTSAKAKLQHLSYVATPGDEVEDLVLLLQKVKSAIPDIQAVCAGALWSDYQRLRVESVASRVGLLSLAYLWRRDQEELLQEMISSGVDAVIIKVAGIGLKQSHLGKTLDEMKSTLFDLKEKYGAHVCGEGGEYETLVRWMPGFKKRLVLDETETVLHDTGTYSSVYYLRILRCSLHELTSNQIHIQSMQDDSTPTKIREIDATPSPFVFEPEERVFTALKNKNGNVNGEEQKLDTCCTVGETESYLYYSVQVDQDGGQGVFEAAKKLQEKLAENSEGLESVISVTLSLNSVSGSRYLEANKGYNRVFAIPECTPPPTRSCVGSFPTSHKTTIEAIVRKRRNLQERDSRMLHVQSLSEWAPPCIGPYSQFVEEDEVIHVCGVIALYPPSAQILEGMSPVQQVRACARNLRKTLEASRSNVDSLGVFLMYVTGPEIVDVCSDQLKESILHNNCIWTALPVSGLPKEGLVEVKSIGTVGDIRPSLINLNPNTVLRLKDIGVTFQGVICNNLAFTIITVSYEQEAHSYTSLIKEILEEVQSNINLTSNLLSLQVFGSESTSRTLTTELTKEFESTAVSIHLSSWLPQEASSICFSTSELSS